MAIRVFSKKAFQFNRRVEKDGLMQSVEKATTLPLAFCELPDWVEKDPLFMWAQQDGDIEVISSKADEKQAELNATVKPPVNTGNVETQTVTGNNPQQQYPKNNGQVNGQKNFQKR